MRYQGALTRAAALTVAMLVAMSTAYAQQGEDLREAAQNPIADLISVPFQNNTNFDIGHTDNTQNVLNIQPVVPIHISDDWNVITRTIMPVISQPQLTPFDNRESGLGDINPTLFLSPAHPGEIIWGGRANLDYADRHSKEPR